MGPILGRRNSRQTPITQSPKSLKLRVVWVGRLLAHYADNDGTDEELAATLELNGRWEVLVGPLIGPDGIRMLSVEATDVSGRFNEEKIPVAVPEPSGLLILVAGAGFVALLERRRRIGRTGV